MYLPGTRVYQFRHPGTFTKMPELMRHLTNNLLVLSTESVYREGSCGVAETTRHVAEYRLARGVSTGNGDAAQPVSPFIDRSARRYEETADGKKEAVRFAFIDSTFALTSRCSSTRRSSSSRRRPSTRVVTRRLPRSRTRSNCLRRCWAPGRAPCSPSPCWHPVRIRR